MAIIGAATALLTAIPAVYYVVRRSFKREYLSNDNFTACAVLTMRFCAQTDGHKSSTPPHTSSSLQGQSPSSLMLSAFQGAYCLRITPSKTNGCCPKAARTKAKISPPPPRVKYSKRQATHVACIVFDCSLLAHHLLTSCRKLVSSLTPHD